MGREFIASIVTVLTAVVGLAIVATLVSKQAQTPQVLSAGGSAFGSILTAAEAPVTGGGGFGSGILNGMNNGSLYNF